MNKNETNEKRLFGVFTLDEVNELHDEYKLNGNPNIALRKIARLYSASIIYALGMKAAKRFKMKSKRLSCPFKQPW